ncbi:MAG: DUF4132 domain-containing protein [Armatimonadota bacterium]
MPTPMYNRSLFQPDAAETGTHCPGVRSLLAASTTLLGPTTPLPALAEEVMRAGRGLPVQTARFRQFTALHACITEIDGWAYALAEIIHNGEEPLEMRVLAAVVWAHARPDAPDLAFPDMLPDDASRYPPALAHCTSPDPGGRYLLLLEQSMDNIPVAADALPEPLLLLSFLKTLGDGGLSQPLFAACVLQAHVLHPDIAVGRPLRRMHRLLDYLGLSADIAVQSAYRQLVAEVWPRVTSENWRAWRWITVPGGPDLFPQALAALRGHELALPRLHEIKYAPLPPRGMLEALLTDAGLETALLAAWLRLEIAEAAVHWPWLAPALRWMTGSNVTAAAEAYVEPDWWAAWLRLGMPAARTVLARLQAMPLPPGVTDIQDCPHGVWLERHLLPNYGCLCANLLLANAAIGEGETDITALAEAEDLASVRALGMLAAPDETVLNLLRRLLRTGGRPLQEAAHNALDRLARRQGLPGAEELERQHLLSLAWEAGPFAGERVRVGWEVGMYRLRLDLRGGKVQLDALGPRGPLFRIPIELRKTDAYRQAREAQREAQQQYRLFKRQLERYMLEGIPFTLGEFRYLLANPIFAHLAERLLWRTVEGDVILWSGPDRWERLDGTTLTLTGDCPATWTLTLVHPVQLGGALVAWQHIAADRRLMQPFKQLFREIYIRNDDDDVHCARFRGYRIDSRRAYAVLRTCGFAPGNGDARRDWPRGITAHLCWAEGVSGRDLFGPHRKTEVTTGAIWFTRGKEVVPLSQVEAVIFSETLRTADLLTTQAAVGEADLTSRETVALRAMLLREVARTFPLTNLAVPEDGQYALVLGKHAVYRVNLASGTVLLEPEGRQLVVPRQDTRWRPVEEGDATTEILGEVLTLAHDGEITDLTFLAQVAESPRV